MGYHKATIQKGELGQFSKIREEFEELTDAVDQKDPILILVEISDLCGAIEEFLKKWNLTIEDTINFSDKTKQSFKEGKRV